MNPSTTAQPALQPFPPRWVAVLVMRDGSCRTSTPVPEYQVAEQIGLASLLDADVSCYEVLPLRPGTGRAAAAWRKP